MFGNPILDLVFAPWAMNTLFAACRLRIFTLLAETEMTADQLAEHTGAVPRLLAALLDASAAMGLLRYENDRYANSHLADAYLVEGRPLYMGDFIELNSAEASQWEGLYDLVLTGQTPIRDRPRQELSPHQFTLAMHNLAMLGEAPALADAVDLSGCKTMVDVGAGSGAYSVALCRRNPHLHSTLLDTVEVLGTARQIVEKSGLGERIETREADITHDSYGHNLDLVLLSDVLYADRAMCTTIIRSAYEALAEGGTLLIRGYFPDPRRSLSLFGSLFALGRQLDDPDRDIISVPLLGEWVDQTGFKNARTFALTSRSTCLTARK